MSKAYIRDHYIKKSDINLCIYAIYQLLVAYHPEWVTQIGSFLSFLDE
jgi:hypothetical protein